MPAAFMFTKQKREKNYVALAGTMHKEIHADHLRIVDPYTDPNVWAIVDDGCNASCHSDKWIHNAMSKWKAKGFTPRQLNCKATRFSGVGQKTTDGQFQIPMGLKLLESGMRIPGVMKSYQIGDSEHPLLISQSVQAMLGFVKDVRNGIITMTDYGGQNLEVVRLVSS